MADAARETQIGIQSRYLIQELEKVTCELENLRERLSPVLSPLAPSVAIAKATSTPPAESLAPHAVFLQDQGNTARDLADEITALRQRVEL